jgi:hypothetical protein
MLRVELSFDYRLDDLFSVPVDKSHIEIDPDFAEELKKSYLQVPVQEAERRREGALRKRQAANGSNLHDPSNQNLRDHAASIKQPGLAVIDTQSGEVELTNKAGKIRIKLPVKDEPGLDGVFIRPVQELTDGVLFEPVVLNGNQGVQLNIGHDFYRKVYLPNRDAGGAILGIDSLLWALCVAELNNCTPSTAATFREIRFELSRILRKLLEEMPDPILEANV